MSISEEYIAKGLSERNHHQKTVSATNVHVCQVRSIGIDIHQRLITVTVNTVQERNEGRNLSLFWL